MTANPIDTLVNHCAAIGSAIPDGWGWDDYMGVALLTFKRSTDEKRILDALGGHLDNHCGAADVSGAPEAVRGLAGETGGLRPGQMLLYTNAEEGPFLFAAIWPWGDGETVSVRLGCRAPQASKEEAAAIGARIKAAFAIA